MKKLRGIFLSIFVGFTAAHAQTVGTTARELAQLSRQVARAAGESSFQMQMLRTAGLTGGQAFQFTQNLQHQAQMTLEQARAASGNIRYPLTLPKGVAPVVGMKIRDKWQLEPHLQRMPGLKKNRDIAPYLVSQENRLLTQEMERLEEHVWPQFLSKIDQLELAAATTPQVADPLRTIAEYLPSSVDMLFVGETHEFPEIQRTMPRLLALLREQQPNRKIILFTEFLPKGFVWEGKIDPHFKWYTDFAIAGFWDKNYRTLWDHASQLDIPSVGLEPAHSCLEGDLCASFVRGDSERVKKKEITFDASLTGIKYRNENFLEVLRTYRRMNPDALFVVYAGSRHVGYNQFASVSAQFEPEKTFVLELLPSVKRIAKKLHTREAYAQELGHPIRDFIWTGDFPQNFQLFNKELAPIAGVDAFIRLETPKK